MSFRPITKIITAIVFILCVFRLNSSIIMQPYLQGVDQHSIYILAECNSSSPVTVETGINETYGSCFKSTIIDEITNKNKTTFIHKVLISGLKENTKYFYRVYQDSGKYYQAEFRTLPGDSAEYSFAVRGDTQSDFEIHELIARHMIKHDPLFSIYLGDLCYLPEYFSWKKEFFTDSELQLISKVPFFNATGNHEGWGKNTKAFTQAPVSSSDRQDYYSFDCGDVHFLILNTEESCRKGSAQYKFAEEDLKNTKKKWKVVAFHKPAYSFAKYHGMNKTMQRFTTEVLEPNNVDIVLCGHTHFYQHNLVNGIHHMILGSAGAPLFTPVTDDRRTVKTAQTYHYAIVNASKEKLSITVYGLKDNVIDVLELSK